MIVRTSSTDEPAPASTEQERHMAAAMKLLMWLENGVAATNATVMLDQVRIIVGQRPFEKDFHEDGRQYDYWDIRGWLANWAKRNKV